MEPCIGTAYSGVRSCGSLRGSAQETAAAIIHSQQMEIRAKHRRQSGDFTILFTGNLLRPCSIRDHGDPEEIAIMDYCRILRPAVARTG